MPTANARNTAAAETNRLVGIVLELHPKSGDNWSRAKLRLPNGSTAWVTAKFRLEKGETFDAECSYNEKYRSYDCVKLSAGIDGEVSNEVIILKLVEVLDGVGKVKARKLGDQFPNLYETLTKEPEKVAAACGASLTSVKQISLDLFGERTTLSRVTTLTGKGWPHHLAKRVAKNDQHYVTALRSPYEAIKLVSGLGWLLADEIGRKQGIAVDDPKRIEAGIDHFYRESVTNDGHTLVHVDHLLAGENLPSLLGVRVGKIAEKLDTTLLPYGDGWYTSKRHYDNATTIQGFFLPSSEVGKDGAGANGDESSTA